MRGIEDKECIAKETLEGPITLSEARQEEDDMLERLTLQDHAIEFTNYFARNHQLVSDLVARQMNVSSPSDVSLAEWIWGSFNASVPVYIRGERRCFIRFPLPFKIGERHFPGNCDEKVKCEAATYTWISENCPDVPIPRLFGYGLGSGRAVRCPYRWKFPADFIVQYTTLDHMPFLVRLFHNARRCLLRLAGCPVPPRYIAHGKTGLAHPYLLIGNVDAEGSTMLSQSWDEHWRDPQRRQNLFRDLSRIMLSVGRIPQPRIGSFTFDENGSLSLTNRPLMMQLNQLENEAIDTGIGRSNVYTNTIPFALDLIQFHDEYVRQQPNAIIDKDDGEVQMATFACMRTVLPHFFANSLRNGPFSLTLTDIHQSNLFVDADWHIRAIIDLEYAIALPLEMQLAPHWLSNQTLDGLMKDTTDFAQTHDEFIGVYRDEERDGSSLASPRADLMDRAWRTGAYFYYHALEIKTGSINTFSKCVRPLYVKEVGSAFYDYFSAFWATNSQGTLARKLQDRASYDARLQAQFSADAS